MCTPLHLILKINIHFWNFDFLLFYVATGIDDFQDCSCKLLRLTLQRMQ